MMEGTVLYSYVTVKKFFLKFFRIECANPGKDYACCGYIDLLSHNNPGLFEVGQMHSPFAQA
ncbi:hypothetical protein X474_08595 [Dethiosulfatarculus sandiegensis]|uniref:Uncharacterized protein n=1 Tax=Dethiosulfatarculus sandiegensis TaxID=1429043 RepID=A0A0D2JF50_9BACT|nr:hypothetical protein X474_08595 [Dethiosulfatarculus sandiegensis]